MKVDFNKIDNVNATLTISLVEDDYRAEYKKTLNEMGRQRPMKGFRPGHMPAALLQKVYGGQAMSRVVDRMVSKALQDYIINNKINVLGEPMLNENTKVDLMTEKEFSFTFDLGISPEINVAVDKNLSIPHYTITVTEQMIDDNVANDRKRYGRQVPGELSQEDSHLTGSLTELDENGDPLEGGITVEKAMIVPQQSFDSAQRDRLVAVKVGDEIIINPKEIAGDSRSRLASLLDRDYEEVKDNTSDFKFTVSEIMVTEPAEMNQEFFDEVLGKDVATTEEEYRGKIREHLATALAREADYRFDIDARAAIMQQAGELELPEAFLKRYFVSVNEGATAEKIDEEFEQARPALRWQLVEGHLMEQFGIKIESADLLEMARQISRDQLAQYGLANAPEDIVDNYAHRILEDERMSRDIRDRARTEKLFAAIREAVTLEEKEVSVDEFNALYQQPQAATDEVAFTTADDASAE